MAEVGRVFRHDGTAWQPIDEPLAAYGHAPPAPQLAYAPWVLPASIEARVGDVVTWGEHAHRLLARCGPDDPAVEHLAAQTMLWHELDEAVAWLNQVEVWMGQLLDGGRPWPLPPVSD